MRIQRNLRPGRPGQAAGLRRVALLLGMVAFPLMACAQSENAHNSATGSPRVARCPVVHAEILKHADVAFMAPARALGLHFPDKPTVIDVLITETGKPSAVHVISSSGSSRFDDWAKRVALASTYSPASSHCKTQPEHFRFVEDWQQVQREFE